MTISMITLLITRGMDIIISFLALIFLLLFFPIIALLIKLDSSGPVFYLCDRVGLNGKKFKMYKFRTMYGFPAKLGHSVSPLRDPRVTTVGRALRRLKLNEFPQFINVLKGDMTLVGPRPEAPDLAALYPDFAKRIFTVKPGLAGPNQILGRNEEELYPRGVDPVKFYIEHILPKKLPVDLEYIDDHSIFKNFKYLFLSVKVTLLKIVSRQHLTDNYSQIFLLMTDMALCLVSFTLAHYLRYEGRYDPIAGQDMLKLLPFTILIRLPIFLKFNFYHTLIRHISLFDVKRTLMGVALSSLFLVGFSFLAGFTIKGYARGVFLIDWFCLTSLLVGYRICLKKIYLTYINRNDQPVARKRVLIWGAGDGGELCLRFLQNEKLYEVIGFIDDDPRKWHRRINGLKILGDRHHLSILTQLYKIHEVFVAILSITETDLESITAMCGDSGLQIRLFQMGSREIFPASPLEFSKGTILNSSGI